MLANSIASGLRSDSKEDIMDKKIKRMVGIGLFTAIVVILQLLGGGIKFFGLFSISLVLIPIVVGAALYGWQAGTLLGFAFGLSVLLSGDAGAFLAVDPLATVLVVILKGVSCGLVSGIVYNVVEKTNRYIAVVLAAVVCPIVNTGVFLLGCKLFFFETITQWAATYGYESVGSYIIFGLTGVNFLVELGANIILAPVITRLIHLGKK